MEDDPFKFLGSSISYRNTPADHLKFLKEKLTEKMDNLDKKCVVRGEFKVATYSRYILPSLRFHLSVHDLHRTHLDVLDQLAASYLKKWLGIPSRGVTNLGLFHPHLLDLKLPSQTYMEGHIGNFLNIKLSSSDPVVKEALECQLSREGKWKKKSSTAVQCQEIFEQLQDECNIPTPENTYLFETIIRKELPKIKKVAQKKIKDKRLTEAKASSSKLAFQGDLCKVLEEDSADIDWKTIIYRVPKGVMSFACRAATNSLATPDNLPRWGRIVDSRCKLCTHSPCTLGHLLSNCKVALDQGRFTYRHDQILECLLKTLAAPGLEGLSFHSDLEGCKVGGGSIPPEIIVTSQRPDLVILDKRKTQTEIHLVELTVPFDTIEGIERARERKSERYAALASDIREQGLKCHLHTLEIGTRGYISPRNRGTITHLCKIAGERKVKEVLSNCSKQALLGSKAIYNARNSPDWG